MKIVQETSLRDFDFWGGAIARAEMFSDREMDIIEEQLEEFYPDGLTDTQINDMFWFDEDSLAQAVGYADYETMCEAKEDDNE